MKSFLNRAVLVAAGALLLGATVWGQTPMTAEIPFAFHAAGATLPAGHYQVLNDHSKTGVSLMRLWNAKERRTAMLIGNPVDRYRGGSGRIGFLCSEGACALSEIRTADGAVNYPARSHKGTENKLVFIPFGSRSGV